MEYPRGTPRRRRDHPLPTPAVYPCLSLERLWHKLDADLPGRGLLDVYDVLAVHEANSITRLKGIYDPAIPHEKTHGNKPTHLVPKAWPEINGGVMVSEAASKSSARRRPFCAPRSRRSSAPTSFGRRFRRNDRSIEFLENWLADYIDNSRSVAPRVFQKTGRVVAATPPERRAASSPGRDGPRRRRDTAGKTGRVVAATPPERLAA